MWSNLALQAVLCYNGRVNIVVLGGACDTPSRIHSWRNVPMTTLSPHADNSNLIPATSGIYKIICIANKKIYVGSAINLRKRKRDHWYYLRQNKHHNPILQNAWNKYGEQVFTFEVLEQVLPISLTAREQYWFNKLKPFGRKGFNVLHEAGSNLGSKHSPEAIEKTRQAHLGKTISPEQRERLRQVNLGKKHTPESRERTSRALFGKKKSPEHSENIRRGKLGHEVSPGTREKISQSLLGRKVDLKAVVRDE